MDFESCLKKQSAIKKLFPSSLPTEGRYQKIIELGKSVPEILPKNKVDGNIVSGCQSIVYLHSELIEEKIYFTAHSEALISRGLAALLIMCYNAEPPETLLKCKPLFLEELGISASLSPGRSNGLSSMLLRMQKDALKFLISH